MYRDRSSTHQNARCFDKSPCPHCDRPAGQTNGRTTVLHGSTQTDASECIFYDCGKTHTRHKTCLPKPSSSVSLQARNVQFSPSAQCHRRRRRSSLAMLSGPGASFILIAWHLCRRFAKEFASINRVDQPHTCIMQLSLCICMFMCVHAAKRFNLPGGTLLTIIRMSRELHAYVERQKHRRNRAGMCWCIVGGEEDRLCERAEV